MTRDEFTGVLLGFIIKKVPSWLPEEAPEEDMLEIIQQRLQEHSFEIRKVFKKKEEGYE